MMIKKYNLFLMNEGISMSNEDIVEIIKHLEDNESKNSALIKKLVNHEDKNGKTVLMNIVQSKNEELIDVVLKYVDDINKITKNTGENVLHFAKNLKIFNKLYNLGVDANVITKINRNMLTHLATKKLFDVELYQQLINDGIDINLKDLNNCSVLSESILNQNIVNLLIKNNVDINNKEIQAKFLHYIFYYYRYYENKRNTLIKTFILLFDNGMVIQNIENFINIIFSLNDYEHYTSDVLFIFISKLKEYISCDLIIKICEHILKKSIGADYRTYFCLKLLEIYDNPNLYSYIKNNYGVRFKDDFKDFIEQHPYLDDSEKFNL